MLRWNSWPKLTINDIWRLTYLIIDLDQTDGLTHGEVWLLPPTRPSPSFRSTSTLPGNEPCRIQPTKGCHCLAYGHWTKIQTYFLLTIIMTLIVFKAIYIGNTNIVKGSLRLYPWILLRREEWRIQRYTHRYWYYYLHTERQRQVIYTL